MSNKLKPCPFCGSDDVKIWDGIERPVCESCCACGPSHDGDAEEAARLWNDRAGDDGDVVIGGITPNKESTALVVTGSDGDKKEYSYSDLPADQYFWSGEHHFLNNLLLAHGIKKGMNDVDQPEIEYPTFSADGSKLFVVENGEVKECSLGEDYRRLFGEDEVTGTVHDANSSEKANS